MSISVPAGSGAQAHLDAMVERRLGGEPLQYVLGSWSFCGLDLLVDRRVLIPRPETEWVVEVALEEAVRFGFAVAGAPRSMHVRPQLSPISVPARARSRSRSRRSFPTCSCGRPT